MRTAGAASPAPLPSTYEVARAQLAGLAAGSILGAALAVTADPEPLWQASSLMVVLVGLGLGGFLGLLAGFAAGVVLRLLRSAPGWVAALSAGLAVVATVAVLLAWLGVAAPSEPGDGLVMGLVAGALAAGASPWIRRRPS